MNTVMNYESIFERYGGIMRTCELTREGISYQVLQNLIEQGRVEKIKYGYYQWQDEKAFTEVSVITALFPKAIICDMSAAMYYGYTDRVPGVWHIAVDNKSARNKFKLDFPIIKPHFIETSRLNIGVSEGNIDGITVKIYDRERVVCDCLRHVNTMDGEVFNIVALYMEHYCEKMNFWGCGHRKKTYGNNLFKKIAYQRLYFHPPSFVYMKDIFYVRRKEVFSCLKSEKKFQNWKSWCRSEERNLSVMRKGHNYILWGCIHFRN